VAASEAWDAYPPDSLLAAGWHQGALFWLPGASYFWNDVPDADVPEHVKTQAYEAKIKVKEPLVLVSQDCDILSKDEPRIEALRVRVKNKSSDRGYIARIANNSFREFVLDAERGLVADARVRLLIVKDVLRGIEPDPWTIDDRTRDDFVDWLAGRYDRPPVPTPVYEAVCRPIRREIERLRADDPGTFVALNRSIRKIRVQLPPPGSADLDLGLLIILEDDIDDEGAQAVEGTVEAIERLITQGTAICNLEIAQVPYSDVLLREYDATRPLDLDYMTDQGDEVELEPLKVVAP